MQVEFSNAKRRGLARCESRLRPASCDSGLPTYVGFDTPRFSSRPFRGPC